MSFLSPPTPPDPTATANAQQQYNVSAGKAQNVGNSYNQSGPNGSMTYVADPNSPSGYSLQTSAGAYGTPLLGAAANLANSSAGMYSSPYDLNAATGATAKTLNDWSSQYLSPIFQQQQSNTEAQLRNQGLMPGTQAYDNAKNLLARNQGDVTNQYLQQNEGQAFDQTMKNYQLPLQTIQGLVQTGSPGNFQQTPTSQIQPANYQGAVQNNYTAQMQNYQNNMSNLGKLVGSGVSFATAGGLGGGGMFGSTPTAGYGNFGQYSPYSPANT